MRKFKQVAKYVAGTAAVISGSAMAAVPAAVTTAVTGAGEDAATVAGAVLVALCALMAFHWMRREAK